MQNYYLQYKRLNLPGRLIVINLAIWACLQILRLITYLVIGSDFYWEEYLALHAGLGWFLHTPWTLLSYFFVHANFGDNVFHIIFNMFWLWTFGQYFLRSHNEKELLKVYLSGGLFSGLVFLLWFNLIPGQGEFISPMVVGASGAIFALVAAVAMRHPEDAIYLNLIVRTVPIKMKWFALIALMLNLMNLTGSNTGGIVCHLGGMLFGLGYGLYERRPKMTASKGGSQHIHNDRQKDHDYNLRQRDYQQKIDAILDKISKSGYEGLTAEEKAILFDASHRKKS